MTQVSSHIDYLLAAVIEDGDYPVSALQARDEYISIVQRAEAAEARAAMLEAQLTGAATVVVTLTTERDAERKEREALYPVLDEKSRVVTMLRADVAQLTAERDGLRVKLEQAQQACSYWLTDGRFLVANSPEYQKAIDMLAINTP